MTYQPNTATDTDLAHIAALVHAARPEWDILLVRIILGSHRTQCAGADLAVAAIRAAQDDTLLTPKAIGWRGPHWRGLTTQPAEVRSAEKCTTCGKPEHRCYTERPGVDDDHVFEAVPR